MAALPNIPMDIITEILIQLPIKSLGRLSRVSREWRSIIKSSRFISLHFNMQQTKFLFRRYHQLQDQYPREQYWLLDVTKNKPFTINSSTLVTFPLFSQYEFFCVVGSCRGIVCLADMLIADPEQPIFLWNPCIRKHLRLPVATQGGSECDPHSFALGFGYSGGDNDDFKVVRFVTYTGNVASVPPRAEVYSIKMPRWRPIEVNDIRLQNVLFAWSPVFLNEVVHWLAYTSQNDSYKISVLRFRVAEEVFDEMPLPNELKFGNYMDLSLTLMGESLAVINYNRHIFVLVFDVWLMERYVDDQWSWNKLYSFWTEGVNPRVVALRQNKEALMAYDLFGLFAHDLENWDTTDLRILGATQSYYIAEYVESLEPLSRD